MANFEYPFTSSGTPNSFPIPGVSLTGIDEAGTLTPAVLPLAAGATLVMSAALTDAQVAAIFQSWLNRAGYSSGGAGGSRPQGSATYLPTLTQVGAAD